MKCYLHPPFSSYEKKLLQKDPDLYMLGKLEMKQLRGPELLCFETYSNSTSTIVPVFYRLQKQSVIFHSLRYKRVKVRNSFTVLFKSLNGTSTYGEIIYFASLKDTVALIRKFEIVPSPPEFFPVSTVVPVKRTDALEVVLACNILEKCMCIDVSSTCTYVARFPNTVHFD